MTHRAPHHTLCSRPAASARLHATYSYPYRNECTILVHTYSYVVLEHEKYHPHIHTTTKRRRISILSPLSPLRVYQTDELKNKNGRHFTFYTIATNHHHRFYLVANKWAAKCRTTEFEKLTEKSPKRAVEDPEITEMSVKEPKTKPKKKKIGCLHQNQDE